jgi:hypothetical protein
MSLVRIAAFNDQEPPKVCETSKERSWYGPQKGKVVQKRSGQNQGSGCYKAQHNDCLMFKHRLSNELKAIWRRPRSGRVIILCPQNTNYPSEAKRRSQTHAILMSSQMLFEQPSLQYVFRCSGRNIYELSGCNQSVFLLFASRKIGKGGERRFSCQTARRPWIEQPLFAFSPIGQNPTPPHSGPSFLNYLLT